MQRRRFVALGTSTVAASLAGCFGPASQPGEDETDLEPGGDGPREVTNELRERLTITDESLLEEDGELTFSLRVENISEESVSADIAVTMLDGGGEAVSDEYVERAVVVEPASDRRVSFDIAESPDTVDSYRLAITESTDASGEDEDSGGE